MPMCDSLQKLKFLLPAKEDFLPGSMALLTGILFILGWHVWGLNRFMWGQADDAIGFGAWWILFALAWFIPILIGKGPIPTKPLIIALLGVGFFAFRMDSYHFFKAITHDFSDWSRRWCEEIWQSTILIFFMILSYFLLKSKEFWGFKYKGHLKPYLIMLVLMVPLVFWASVRPDFRAQYPKALFGSGIQPDPTQFNLRWLVIEIWYGLDFITIEWFFRGFFMLGMVRYFGRKAIWAMCLFYLAIHLGKPWPETLSSFFGGYILSMFGLHSKSIWGGVIVHMGIAWLMEWMVFL